MEVIQLTEVGLDFSRCQCSECGIVYYVPIAWRKQRSKDHSSFYCPNGHGQYFPTKTDADLLKEQLKNVKAQLDKAETEKTQLNLKLNGALEQLDKAHKGHCPHCNKIITNQNLKRHIHCKHPDKEVG